MATEPSTRKALVFVYVISMIAFAALAGVSLAMTIGGLQALLFSSGADDFSKHAGVGSLVSLIGLGAMWLCAYLNDRLSKVLDG